MKLIQSISIRAIITVVAVVIGWASIHGALMLYVELFGPFYPGPDQQQRNAENYLINVIIAMIFFNFLGHWLYSRWLKSKQTNK